MHDTVVRSLQPPSGSYFLFGPRGTGKTTLLRVLHPDAVFVDLLDPATARELSARPAGRACPQRRLADEELSFWRTRSGVEVDCVVYGPTRFEAIEVKNSARVRPEDERGLRAFLTDYPEARATVVYRGERPLERSGIRWIPVDTFLRSLSP